MLYIPDDDNIDVLTPRFFPPSFRHIFTSRTRRALRPLPNFALLHAPIPSSRTWAYWIPEMCAKNSLFFSGYMCDVWAAGICLHVFATGRLPFYSEAPMALFDAIAEADVGFDDLALSGDLVDLLKRVLARDPGERAGVVECLGHRF